MQREARRRHLTFSHDRRVYFLVTLLAGPRFGEVEVDHEPFIDSLTAEHLVLLGGDLVDAGQGVRAAYVLRCNDLAAAKAIVATDPLVSSGSMRAQLAESQLVGIDLGAVDDDLT
jgi:uncharacterized protein YciI